MKQDANEGLGKVYWITIVTMLAMVVLGAILWWWDDYENREAHNRTSLMPATTTVWHSLKRVEMTHRNEAMD